MNDAAAVTGSGLARSFLLLAILLTILVYLPGMTGGFVFDDFPNILTNSDLRPDEGETIDLIQAGWSGTAGPLKRPLSMMSFAVNFATTGEFVGGFKITNLVIHLINGVLVFVLFRLILVTHSDRLTNPALDLSMVAAIGAAIWLVHPLNLTSVLYIVQRMTSMAALFSLAAMICYCVGRRRMLSGIRRAWWIVGVGVPAFVLLGALSKENAVLTVPLIALIEVCFFRFQTTLRRDKSILIALTVITVVLPAVAAAVLILAEPALLTDRFAGRAFTLQERLLTEARALWFYLGQFLLPRLSQFGIYHDDFEISKSLFDPRVTAFAVGGLVAALVVSALAWRRYPLVTFAILWFLIGHALESSVIALELVHEHRNYVPILGIILALAYGVAAFAAVYLRRAIRTAMVFAVVFAFAGLTFLRAGDWSDPGTLALVEAERHPRSYRSVFELARIQFGLYKLSDDEQDYVNALTNLERAGAIEPTATGPYAALLKLEYAHGNVPKPEWKQELLHRYRHALFHPSETQDLHQMVKCRANKNCSFPPELIVELFGAALANPTIPDSSKAQLMVDLAVFFINEIGDFTPAIALLDEAVELAPMNFSFRNARVQSYTLAGRHDEAAVQIAALKLEPRWDDEVRPPQEAIALLEISLDEARTSAREPDHH